MFVLKECSVCREDFNSERLPHNIPCGHVFCRPCLQLMSSSSRNCPDCQTPYSSNLIRAVVCAVQDPAPNGTCNQTNEPEGETLLWQVINSAVECPEDPAQRKFLATLCSEGGASTRGWSVNSLAAFNLLNILVRVDESNQSLEDKVETSQAIEQSLRDRISMLEEQLLEDSDTGHPSMSDYKLLMADFRKIQSSIETINKNTSDIAQSLKSGPVPPAPLQAAQAPTRPSQTGTATSPSPLSPPVTPEVNRVAPRQAPDTESQDATDNEVNFMNNRGRASDSPTTMPAFRAPNYTIRVMPPRQSETSSSTSSPFDAFSTRRQPSQTSATASNGPTTPSSSSTSSSLPPPPPASEIPSPRKLTVLFDFDSDSPVKHSLTQGETLYLTPESDPERDWIWCKNADGKGGYAPKGYVRVDNA